MKKIAQPIRIWRLKDAPKRYRKLLKEITASGKIAKSEAEEYVWIASIRGPEGVNAWWPNPNRAAPTGTMVRNLSAGVLFGDWQLEGETVWYFTDNDLSREINAMND